MLVYICILVTNNCIFLQYFYLLLFKGDKVGEARACWSLGNAHSSVGDHEKALEYAEQHYGLARDVSLEFILLLFKNRFNNIIRIFAAR